MLFSFKKSRQFFFILDDDEIESCISSQCLDESDEIEVLRSSSLNGRNHNSSNHDFF